MGENSNALKNIYLRLAIIYTLLSYILVQQFVTIKHEERNRYAIRNLPIRGGRGA